MGASSGGPHPDGSGFTAAELFRKYIPKRTKAREIAEQWFRHRRPNNQQPLLLMSTSRRS